MKKRIRREYLIELQARLYEREAAIDDLRARARASGLELRPDQIREIENLRRKVEKIHARIAEAGSKSSPEVWPVLRGNLNRALEKLGVQLNKIRDSLESYV